MKWWEDTRPRVSTVSRKPTSSTIHRLISVYARPGLVTKWMGVGYVLSEISPESNYVQTLQKSCGRNCNPLPPRVYTYAVTHLDQDAWNWHGKCSNARKTTTTTTKTKPNNNNYKTKPATAMQPDTQMAYKLIRWPNIAPTTTQPITIKDLPESLHPEDGTDRTLAGGCIICRLAVLLRPGFRSGFLQQWLSTESKLAIMIIPRQHVVYFTFFPVAANVKNILKACCFVPYITFTPSPLLVF